MPHAFSHHEPVSSQTSSLLEACKTGNTALVETVLKSYININCRNDVSIQSYFPYQISVVA